MDMPTVLDPVTAPGAPPAVGPSGRYDSDDDWRWMQEERMKPDQGVFALYAGLWVAVVNKVVVGAAAPGPAAMSLRERVAERYALQPHDLVVIGLSDPHVIECG